MKRSSWQILLGISLVVLSALFYALHYLLFRDSHHIFIYLLGDIAFVFIEVLMVTLIIHRVLEEREKSSRMEKLNMVIGAFFSEVGTKLLDVLSECDPGVSAMQQGLDDAKESNAKRFKAIAGNLKEHKYLVDGDKLEWDALKSFLQARRAFLLRLMENPNLLEHESFTDMLWAVFHLDEELEARESISGLPATDLKHLAGDANRAYGRVAKQWLKYMAHLEGSYPYLFSLSLRTNPFDSKATPVVEE